MFIGIMGGFSGTVGTVVGSTNKKGDDIIRAKSKKSRTVNSVGQVKQQTRFGLVTGFMQGLNPVIKTGLKSAADAENMSPFNYACRHAINNALAGTDEQPEIDYSRILLSDGPLSRMKSVTATPGDGEVNFIWSDNVENSIGELTDKVCLVVYNASNRELSFSNAVVTRSAKTASVHIPYSTAGDTLLFYLFFRSDSNALLVSTSQYLGTALAE